MEILNFNGNLFPKTTWDTTSVFTRPALELCTILEAPYADVYIQDFINDVFNETLYQDRKTLQNDNNEYNGCVRHLNKTNYLESNYNMFNRVSAQDGQDYYDRHQTEFDNRVTTYNRLQELQVILGK